MRVALLQTCASDDVSRNLDGLLEMLEQAAQAGADLVLTPEVTNIVSMDRAYQTEVLKTEAEDDTLRAVREFAAQREQWVLLGSLALKSDPPEARFANRSLLIDDKGSIKARYDKMHMFDVQVSETETYCESSGYAPGERAVVAATPWAKIGMTICYDIRFAYLYRALAKAGAEILTVPAAFSPGTGPMHWQPLLQARAIETGAFAIAPAQTGTHDARSGRTRRTYGHSMVISPWGEVLLDAGTQTGVFVVDLDLSAVAEARRKVPSLTHDRVFEGPL
ncbi:carbon-nitrogen hydrolase family protein [Pacificoceanicola onchidii]|uniref:carbon-nitrogen hydrolase family protein n=1 Tax=Pacificoceanicola onchidii TaxID=2562685 RepID=UPI0010A5E18A|nr:carbon-nitrogen hydrolase family protein [Pacificoceanicola onchidii]